MINVKINDETYCLPTSCNLAQALVIYGLKEAVYAVAHNGKIIPRAHHQQTWLQENSTIAVIVPMAGG